MRYMQAHGLNRASARNFGRLLRFRFVGAAGFQLFEIGEHFGDGLGTYADRIGIHVLLQRLHNGKRIVVQRMNRAALHIQQNIECLKSK
ncbi:hypothetical protein SDC9_187817 [bioreactor metagenome]|uniref:Uncharacterized protein n=1 Tax=bioreactor metagenome TaxID=1076179 RepID=A0A645HMK0_9ZZZZ